MRLETNNFYDFGAFRLDLSEKVLLHNGQAVALTPKVFETLQIFVESPGKLIEKDELMQLLWKDRFVEESNLTFNIKMLRKALGDNRANPRFIETVPKRGYRFVAEVREIFQENTSSPFSTVPIKRNYSSFRKKLFSAAVILIISLVLIVFGYVRNKNQVDAPVLSAPFGSKKLSTDGKVFTAAISADGKAVVYTSGTGSDKQSVWLRQLESSNNVQIIPPLDVIYYGLAISPDGNFLYFARRQKDFEGQADIYRVSIFGGVPTKIASETQGNVSVSADGEKISFQRCYYREDEYCSLWIADSADGKNERKLVSRPRPVRIGDNRISPDGRSVVFAVGQSENQANEFGLAEIDIESGTERELTPKKFFDIRHLAWLPDGIGLLLTASQIPNKNFRIWQVSAATGDVEPLTKDSESYSTLSLDSAASRLITTQVKQDFRLYLLNTENPAVPPRVLTDATNVTFAPSGKIVFTSLMTGDDEIWSINADGGEKQQLTINGADDRYPVVSPDNSWIFFTSNRTGEAQIWRMNADGSNQVQITQKEGGHSFLVSPDGKWLYYHHALNRTLWRVLTTGGEEQIVLNKRKHRFAVSPDGLRVAFHEMQGNENILTVISLADGETVKTFTFADQKANLVDLKWSSDGENLAYILANNKFENNILWFQPLANEPPRQISYVGDEQIADAGLALAPDGKSFVVAHGGWLYTAVLLEGLR